MNKIKILGMALLVIYVALSLFISIYTSANSTAEALVKYDLIVYMPIIFFIGSSIATFMFTMYNAKSSMFNSNDNDLLLAMPIKPSTILASRLIFIILWNMLISLAIMTPVFAVYVMNAHVTLSFYLYAVFIFLLLPVVPTIISSIIGYIIAYLTSKSNIKNWFEIILSLIFMGAIYYVMYRANDILNYIILHNEELKNIIKWGFYPVYLILEMLKDNNYLSLLIFIIFNVGLFTIFTYILSINFKRIIAKLQENRVRSNFVMKTLRSESISKTLFMKEAKRYFSSPIYVFNTLFGPMIILVVAVASIFFDKNMIMSVLGVSGGENMIFQLLVAAVLFISFFTSTTSCSISIEGKNFWVMKTLPLNPKDIFKGKMALNLVLILPAAYLALIILFITLNLTLMQLITLFVLVSISALATVQLGLLVNLKFPKMDATNDVVIVKRSASPMISMLVPLVTIMITSSLYAGLSNTINFNVLLGVVVILLMIMVVVEHRLLNTWGQKRFNEID
jgi:ABC-2 type transport system permease protein